MSPTEVPRNCVRTHRFTTTHIVRKAKAEAAMLPARRPASGIGELRRGAEVMATGHFRAAQPLEAGEKVPIGGRAGSSNIRPGYEEDRAPNVDLITRMKITVFVDVERGDRVRQVVCDDHSGVVCKEEEPRPDSAARDAAAQRGGAVRCDVEDRQ